jgi:hypothetical protein
MYKSCAQTIQSELNAANANQKEYDDESEEIRHADEEIEEARSILRLKFPKWKLIEQKDKRDEADRREVERNKPMLLALQQIHQQMQMTQKQIVQMQRQQTAAACAAAEASIAE